MALESRILGLFFRPFISILCAAWSLEEEGGRQMAKQERVTERSEAGDKGQEKARPSGSRVNCTL